MFSIASAAMVPCIAGIMKDTWPGGTYRVLMLPSGVRTNCALPPGNLFLRSSRHKSVNTISNDNVTVHVRAEMRIRSDEVTSGRHDIDAISRGNTDITGASVKCFCV